MSGRTYSKENTLQRILFGADALLRCHMELDARIVYADAQVFHRTSLDVIQPPVHTNQSRRLPVTPLSLHRRTLENVVDLRLNVNLL